MVAIHGDCTIYCDVDGTLVDFEYPLDTRPEDLLYINGIAVLPNFKHVKKLQQFKARNFKIVVWSQGGSHWAESVVHLLGIEEIVDIVISKPNWFIDDLPANEFMPEINRVFLK